MARTNAQIAREARRRTNARRFLAAHPEPRTQIEAHLGAVSIHGATVDAPAIEGVHGATVPQESRS